MAMLLALVATLVLVIAAGVPSGWALYASRRLAEAAERQARTNLAIKNVQAARLEGQRGQWRTALANLDEALACGHPDPVLVRLERIKAD
jgi:hypothetical protein